MIKDKDKIDNSKDNPSALSSQTYIPKDYWLARGKVYKEQFQYDKRKELQEVVLLDYLKGLSFGSVLELGCGFGRITRLLALHFDIQEYCAVDISPHQIENAKNYLKPVIENKKNLNIDFLVSDIQSLSPDRKYDLVISCEVLLHILPDEIQSVMLKLAGLSKRHVINIDWYQDSPPEKIAPHNFLHQYERIYRQMPNIRDIHVIPIVKKGLLSKIDSKQSLFHAVVE